MVYKLRAVLLENQTLYPCLILEKCGKFKHLVVYVLLDNYNYSYIFQAFVITLAIFTQGGESFSFIFKTELYFTLIFIDQNVVSNHKQRTNNCLFRLRTCKYLKMFASVCVFAGQTFSVRSPKVNA